MLLNLEDTLWAGTESGLMTALLASEGMRAKLMAGGFPSADSEDSKSRLLTQIGSVGVIDISGPLVNSDSFMLQFFGLTGYPEIRRAAVEAAKDPAIRQVVLNIGSPGGQVSGCSDTADLLARIDSKVKPITTFASGDMASAAYWLGASARKIYGSKTTVSGSIGVIVVHTEAVKARQAAGLTDVVLRGGKYKALGHPYEPFTEVAQEKLQSLVDSAYSVFVDYVAAQRGVTVAEAEKKMTQGREFFGADGVTAGVLDGISTFDAVIGGLNLKK